MPWIVEHGTPRACAYLCHSPGVTVQRDRRTAGAVRVRVDPVMQKQAITVASLLDGVMRHPEGTGDLAGHCRVRQAVVSPSVSGARHSRWWPNHALVLHLDTADESHARRALHAAQSRLRDCLGELAIDTAPEVSQRPAPARDAMSTALAEDDALLYASLDTLELGLRTLRALTEPGLSRVGELLGWTPTQLLGLPLLGRRGLREIQEALAARGLCLAPDRPRWRP